MNIDKISVPEIYKSSWDFRFFLQWFKDSLSKIQHDTENLVDLYDPLRCPDWLLWMLGDTIGFRYDDRLPVAFNRLVILYFMSMIRNKGSKDGVTLAAEVNLAQFNLLEYGKSSDILYNRLEDTSIPVNSAYVNPHTAEGYIDVVYFSQRTPIDACIEYVRPLGMYCFASAGVRFDARTKISVDPRLTNIEDIGISIGATHVGHYRREDYARVQRVTDTTSNIYHDDSVLDQVEMDTRIEYTKPPEGSTVSKRQYYQEQRARLTLDKRIKHERAQRDEYYPGNGTYYRNPEYEGKPSDEVYAGLRSLYSLQLCNNEHVMKSLIPGIDPDVLVDQYKIFGIGYTPQDESTTFDDNYVVPDLEEPIDGKNWNLRYDKAKDFAIGPDVLAPDVYVNDESRSHGVMNPRPAVNPVMMKIGDAISMDDAYLNDVENRVNRIYTKTDDDVTHVEIPE